ncbi:cytochrome P450 [Pelagophyceae sp. CCMP2097]|nr:cytochrome P450 [Pelagophyceae sp. CCMP2097]
MVVQLTPRAADAGAYKSRVVPEPALLIVAVCAVLALRLPRWVGYAVKGASAAYGAALLWQHRRKAGEPPVVWSWVPFLGSATAFGTAPRKWLLEQAARHGNTFTAVIAGERTCFVCDADVWPKVFREKAALQFKSIAIDVMTKAFAVPSSDVAAAFSTDVDAAAHAQFVKCLQGKQSLDAMTLDVWRHLADEVDALDGDKGAGGVVKGLPLFGELGFPLYRATMTALIADDFGSAEAYADFRAFDAKFGFLAGGAPHSFFAEAKQGLENLAKRFSESAGYAKGPNSALMRERKALFESAEKDAGNWSKLSHGKVQAAMLWAAAANTVPAALWTLYWIAKDSDIQLKVRAEVAALVGGGDLRAKLADPAVLDGLDSALPQLDACISEALRLTSASLTIRKVRKPYAVPGSNFSLRVGDRLALYPPLVHFDEKRVGADPEAFRGDRYADAAVPLMPFGGGVSMCPGRTFARREVKSFLVVILSRYAVTLDALDAPPPQLDATRVGLGIIPPARGADALITLTRL